MAITARIDVPDSIDDALQALATPGARPIGGGVALLLRRRLGEPPAGRYVALGRLPELRGIEVDPDGGDLVVGGSATLAELASADVANGRAPALAAAARASASAGIRSIATVGGNIADAAAASDLVAAAIALGATLEIRSAAGHRRVALAELASSPDSPIAHGEVIATLRVPAPAGPWGWDLQRLQTQGRGDRPAVTLALTLAARDGSVTGLAAAATFVGDRPVALRALAEATVGMPLVALASGQVDAHVRAAALAAVDAAAEAGLMLLDDARASRAYRRDVLAVVAGRAAIRAARGAAS